MTAYEAEEIYCAHVDMPYGKEWTATVRRFTAGFLADKVCRDWDSAYAKAVETSLRLLPVIIAKATK